MKLSRIGGRHTRHKAEATIAYVFLIVLTVGALLFIQNYLKRSMMGQLQAAGDQLGDQYALGLTNGHERHSWQSFYFELRTAGLNNPTRITVSSGSASSSELRKLRPVWWSWP